MVDSDNRRVVRLGDVNLLDDGGRCPPPTLGDGSPGASRVLVPRSYRDLDLVLPDQGVGGLEMPPAQSRTVIPASAWAGTKTMD